MSTEAVQVPKFQTGIYRHFKNGDLYFANGLVTNAETSEEMVLYLPLCKQAENAGFVRKRSNFEEIVIVNYLASVLQVLTQKRFTLVQALPIEHMPVLLSLMPGALCRSSWVRAPHVKVVKLFEKDGTVYVRLENLQSEIIPAPVRLSSFLDRTLVVCKSAE
jgi:hypothetical protein